MRRAVSSWWNSVTSVKPTATQTQRVATTIPKAPPRPDWARFYPHGGRWMWNGHGDWDWPGTKLRCVVFASSVFIFYLFIHSFL
jgi:hypothetical protein